MAAKKTTARKTVKKTTKSATRATKRATKSAKAPRASAALPTPRVVTPYLAVNNAAAEIEWIKKVFGAKETTRQMAGPTMIMHAALRLGDSEIYLADIFPGSDVVDPARVGASVTLTIYHKDIQKFWERAIANGAKVTMPLAKQFWGAWYGQLRDPQGHAWAFSFPAKMSPAEMEKLRVEAMSQMGGAGEMPQ